MNEVDLERVIGICCIVVVLIFVAVLVFAVCAPHDFEGYYLKGNKIIMQRTWIPDESAIMFTEERWQEILENNLHVKIKDNN